MSVRPIPFGRCTHWVICLALVFAGARSAAAEGLLSLASSTVNGDGDEPTPPARKKSDDKKHCDESCSGRGHGDDDWGSLCGQIVFTLFSPAEGPPTDFPMWRLSGSAGGDFNDLDRYQFALAYFPPSAVLGFDLEQNFYGEARTGGGRDHASVGQFNILCHVLDAPTLQGGLGAGVDWFDSSTAHGSGWNLAARLEVELHPQWFLSGAADYGRLGDAYTLHARGHLTRQMGEFVELNLGYDYRSIGRADLQGPYLGLGLRF